MSEVNAALLWYRGLQPRSEIWCLFSSTSSTDLVWRSSPRYHNKVSVKVYWATPDLCRTLVHCQL